MLKVCTWNWYLCHMYVMETPIDKCLSHGFVQVYMVIYLYIYVRDFRNIKQFLTQDAAVSVANAFVSSQLDYCNSLFKSLSKVNLQRLQSILT